MFQNTRGFICRSPNRPWKSSFVIHENPYRMVEVLFKVHSTVIEISKFASSVIMYLIKSLFQVAVCNEMVDHDSSVLVPIFTHEQVSVMVSDIVRIIRSGKNIPASITSEPGVGTVAQQYFQRIDCEYSWNIYCKLFIRNGIVTYTANNMKRKHLYITYYGRHGVYLYRFIPKPITVNGQIALLILEHFVVCRWTLTFCADD